MDRFGPGQDGDGGRRTQQDGQGGARQHQAGRILARFVGPTQTVHDQARGGRAGEGEPRVDEDRRAARCGQADDHARRRPVIDPQSARFGQSVAGQGLGQGSGQTQAGTGRHGDGRPRNADLADENVVAVLRAVMPKGVPCLVQRDDPGADDHADRAQRGQRQAQRRKRDEPPPGAPRARPGPPPGRELMRWAPRQLNDLTTASTICLPE